MRFADGRPLDTVAVPLFMDSWPPPMFATFLGGGAPTLELTVQWREDNGAKMATRIDVTQVSTSQNTRRAGKKK